jgi:ubiquinone/menaquinone biosynthesis C-methylase UbiE
VLLCGSASPYTTLTFARFVGRRQPHLDVLDISPYALDQSARYLQTHQQPETMDSAFVEGDALDMPFDDATFDWIETDFFMQFFPAGEKVRLFHEWARVLKPGGVIPTRDWLTDGRALPDRAVRRFKNWLIGYMLDAVTYDTSTEEVQRALEMLGLLTAVAPVELLGAIGPGVPGMKHLFAHKPLANKAASEMR